MSSWFLADYRAVGTEPVYVESPLTSFNLLVVLTEVFSFLLSTLSCQWYANPDYNLFSPYVVHRKLHPEQPFYILHPRYVWQLWDVIQSNTQENIQPNPPSSGFIGQYTHIQSICLLLRCNWSRNTCKYTHTVPRKT